MKEKLWAKMIARRKATIIDVPEEMRETVMELLSTSDRKRQEYILERGE